MSPIRAVWFDVGEVLINETREYHTWADRLGIPRHTFSAMFGAVIARSEDYRQVFQDFRPDFNLDAQRQTRLDAGLGEYLNGNDLYPDVRPCLHALQDAGYFVGIAGNQTTRTGRFLRELNLPHHICLARSVGLHHLRTRHRRPRIDAITELSDALKTLPTD